MTAYERRRGYLRQARRLRLDLRMAQARWGYNLSTHMYMGREIGRLRYDAKLIRIGQRGR